MRIIRRRQTYAAALAAGITVSGIAAVAEASSHREAPAIGEDQFVDNTDVYAFISSKDANNLVIIVNYVPLLFPAPGPNFYKFSDNARYDIHIDNTGDAVPDIGYRFTFNSQRKNGKTFLYNTGAVDSLADPDLNVTQTYRLEKVNERTGKAQTIIKDVPVAPWNVGIRSFPDYEKVALQAVRTSGNIKVFAGPRDEPFFVDLHVFDLLGVGGAPTTDGINVMSLVLEVPITDVTASNTRPYAGATGKDSVVGIYATASRPRIRFLRDNHPQDDFGDYVQVSRLGWPLVNEVIVPLQDKDKYNRSSPKNDVANFGAYILFPEVSGLLNKVLGVPCPATPSAGRTDIVTFLSASGTKAADLLRININQGQSFTNTAFPNGRKLTD